MRFLAIIVCLFASLQLKAQSPLWHAEAHPDGLQVNELAYTSDGSKIIAGTNCHPAKIRYFDSSDGDLLWDFSLGNDLFCVMGVGISSSEKYICAVEEFGNIIVFDNQNFPPDSIGFIDLGADYAFSIDFSPVAEMAVVGASNGKMLICDLNSLSVQKSVVAHNGWVTEVAYNTDGTLIYSGGQDGTIKIWTSSGTIVDSLVGHTSEITALVIDQNNLVLYSSSKDKSIKKWDLTNKQLLTTLNQINYPIYDITLSTDEQWLASTSFKGIHLIKTNDLSVQDSIEESTLGIGITMDWSPINENVAVGTQKGNVVVYDLENYVGFNELSSQKINAQVFPNPSSGSFILEFPQTIGHMQLSLVNITGQLVGNWNFTNEKRAELTTDLPPGIYSLIISTDQGAERISVIIN